MSKLQELIREMCPEGVEFRKLGDVCEFQRGNTITAKEASDGDVPVIAGGQKPAYYHNVANRQGKNVVIAGSGAYAGFVTYWEIPIFVSDAFSVNPNDSLDAKYLYYCLKNIQEKIHATKKGSGVPHVHGSSIAKFEIPVPPLPVQEEIVRILDHFTELAAELQAELQARKEQYEYYRNKLLTFTPPRAQSVTWMKMSEICSVYTGGEIPKSSIVSDVKTGLYKYPIYANGKDIYGYSDSYRIKDDAVCISSIGANAGTVFFKKGCFTPIIRLKVIVPLKNIVNTKYLYYAVSTLRIKAKGNGGIPNINANDIKKLLVPIPSLSEQQRIVGILDKFETLVNDLTQGLPAEIAAVRKQYEYYRNKLLNFKRIA